MLNETSHRHLHERSAPAVRTPADRKALLHAAEVIGLCDEVPQESASGRMDELLDAIVPLLAGKGQIVRGYGASWLWQLAAKHEAAADRLRQALESPHARTRLILVQYIGFAPASGDLKIPLEYEVLRHGLLDKSAIVRLFSAETTAARLYFDLLPELHQARLVERHAKPLRSLEHGIEALVNGYYTHDVYMLKNVETLSVWFRIKRGSCGLSIPRSVADSVGLTELVRRARARRLDRSIPGFQYEPLPPGYENAGVWPDSVTKRTEPEPW